ncbi:GroES-like protein [Bimuria novae-zelandiae CBS 107.79]|uniref:GroES-like protein n=1 Tax=Bimuria novae-zelandiae CBS 107.79 TaxID=1447943 RepID=A0A6A5V8C5_9PLEO|nr:GroES-like protein [Bimuria novae-zelandiae CBS 107.79]
MHFHTVFKGSPHKDIVEAIKETSPFEGDQVRVTVTAAGLCASDNHFRSQDMVLGHEGIGVVQETGLNVRHLREGDRVGWGFQHNSCQLCKLCLQGNEVYCQDRQMYGVSNLQQGAFATSAVWRESFLIPIPKGIKDEHAAPLMCAGATVISSLKYTTMTPGSTVGVLGLGGLGHLAVLFASKLGFRVIVISSSPSKRSHALELGAHQFYDLNVALSKGMEECLDALLIMTSAQHLEWRRLPTLMAPGGCILPLGIIDTDINIPLVPLVTNGLLIKGSIIAARHTMLEMLGFAVTHDIKPVVRESPLSKPGIMEAMDLLAHGAIIFRAVFMPTRG